MVVFPGYDPVMAPVLAVFTRQNKIITELLEGFVSGEGNLNGVTFRHIQTYLESGVDSGRLGVALMDAGFTPSEIFAFRVDGKTTKEVAQIWLDKA